MLPPLIEQRSESSREARSCIEPRSDAMHGVSCTGDLRHFEFLSSYKLQSQLAQRASAIAREDKKSLETMARREQAVPTSRLFPTFLLGPLMLASQLLCAQAISSASSASCTTLNSTCTLSSLYPGFLSR